MYFLINTVLVTVYSCVPLFSLRFCCSWNWSQHTHCTCWTTQPRPQPHLGAFLRSLRYVSTTPLKSTYGQTRSKASIGLLDSSAKGFSYFFTLPLQETRRQKGRALLFWRKYLSLLHHCQPFTSPKHTCTHQFL